MHKDSSVLKLAKTAYWAPTKALSLHLCKKIMIAAYFFIGKNKILPVS